MQILGTTPDLVNQKLSTFKQVFHERLYSLSLRSTALHQWRKHPFKEANNLERSLKGRK